MLLSAALVVGLLLGGSPACIARLIVASLSTVDRHAWMGPSAHVIEECL
jgi:hypothetical protein